MAYQRSIIPSFHALNTPVITHLWYSLLLAAEMLALMSRDPVEPANWTHSREAKLILANRIIFAPTIPVRYQGILAQTRFSRIRIGISH